MTRFIEVTHLEGGQPQLINTDYVVRIAPAGEHTLLSFNGFLEKEYPNFMVQESYDTVRQLLHGVIAPRLW
ncbi:hypothetical protein [Hymenobacter norwichensis]|jgi:hypothetical protein|uniref:hypothetical protein n=1 Tax=Hymenobacter norwichensis TaxID=223903 RepID=UPI0003B594C3|nr:hypothetical protein [Hymenobacter norwichensis]